jgi:hypothetical protein
MPCSDASWAKNSRQLLPKIRTANDGWSAATGLLVGVGVMTAFRYVPKMPEFNAPTRSLHMPCLAIGRWSVGANPGVKSGVGTGQRSLTVDQRLSARNELALRIEHVEERCKSFPVQGVRLG